MNKDIGIQLLWNNVKSVFKQKETEEKETISLFASSLQSPVLISCDKRKKGDHFLSAGEVYFVKLQNWVNE